ncbi:hypothetical protein CY34DRAFT_805086, partial [Suillus luteus UH-Slu-Lm8-n1]
RTCNKRTYPEAPTYDIVATEALKKEETERTEPTQQRMQCKTSAQKYSMQNHPHHLFSSLTIDFPHY